MSNVSFVITGFHAGGSDPEKLFVKVLGGKIKLLFGRGKPIQLSCKIFLMNELEKGVKVVRQGSSGRDMLEL